MPPTHRPSARLIVCALLLAGATACVAPAGDTPEARRAAVRAMHDEVLAEARSKYPDLQARLATSPAYAVVELGIIKTLFGHVSGYGVVVDQVRHTETFVTLSSWTFGPLAEFGTAASVITFNSLGIVDELRAGTAQGQFVAEADASFKFGDFGGGYSGTAAWNRASVHRVFRNGLGLDACVAWVSLESDPALGP